MVYKLKNNRQPSWKGWSVKVKILRLQPAESVSAIALFPISLEKYFVQAYISSFEIKITQAYYIAF